jgi:hypothetical protein
VGAARGPPGPGRAAGPVKRKRPCLQGRIIEILRERPLQARGRPQSLAPRPVQGPVGGLFNAYFRSLGLPSLIEDGKRNRSNRCVRTRMHGGVAGVGGDNRRPYADQVALT